MKNEQLVTIVIPTYNRKNMLKKSLESAINQTYANLEILISDNHSTDGTEELCQEYLKKDSRIKYFRHLENIGMTNNNNFIHKKVSGEFFVILCDDDWLDTDYVKKCLDYINTHDGYVLVTPTTFLHDENYMLIKKCSGEKLDYKNKKDRFIKYIKLMKLENYLATGLFKTSIAKEIWELEGLLQKDRFAEDWVFMLKYAAAGKIKLLSTTHYHKLNNGNSTTFEGLAQLWTISEDRYFLDMVTEAICSSMKTDSFFHKYLTQAEIDEISTIIEALLKERNKPKNSKQILFKILKEIISCPSFIFSKTTYIKAFKTVKILFISHI